MLETKEATHDVMVAALIGGSRHNNFMNILVEKPPACIAKVMRRAEIFMNAEETLKGRRHALDDEDEDEEEVERPVKRREEGKKTEAKTKG